MKKESFLKIAAAVLASSALAGCSSDKATEAEGFYMDSYAQFKVWGGEADKLSQTAKDLDSLFSMYNENSDIYKINNSDIEVHVSDDTISVINDTIRLSEEFGGSVDITVGGLTLLWNVTSDEPEIPASEEIEAELSRTGIKKIEVDSAAGTVFSNGAVIDLGAVAKGYACDKIKTQLDLMKAQCAVVTFGSSSLLYGEKPDGKSFKIAIKDPEADGSILGMFEADSAFISTSGGYERFFELDGVKYQHILDISTGCPVKTDLISVTVICDSGLRSDFLSTQIYIEGTNGLEKHLNADGYSVIAVTQDKNIYLSDALKDSFELSANGYTVVP